MYALSWMKYAQFFSCDADFLEKRRIEDKNKSELKEEDIIPVIN